MTPTGARRLLVAVVTGALWALTACGTERSAPAASATATDSLLIMERAGRSGRPSVSVVRPDGSGRRKLADGVDASFSPDGRQVAVVVDEGAGPRSLAIVDLADGRSRPVPLPSRPGSNGPDSVTWSPGGGRLAYTRAIRAGEEPPWELATVRTDGTAHRRLIRTRPGEDLDAARWSSPARRVAYSLGQMTIESVRADGTHRRRIYGRRGKTIVADPAWSPDGRRLAVGTGDADDEVAIIRRDGREERRLANAYGPVWSPDGRRVAVRPATGTPDRPVIVSLANGRRIPLGSPHASVLDWSSR